MQPISYDLNRENQLKKNQEELFLDIDSNKRSQTNSSIFNQCSLDMDVFSIGDANS